MTDKTENTEKSTEDTVTDKMVTAAYVTVRVKDTAGQYVTLGFYEGSILPETTHPEDVERLERKGMVADKDSPEAEFAAPAGTPKPGEPPNVAVTEVPAVSLPLAERQRLQREAADSGEGGQDASDRPRDYAPKSAWVEHAVAQRAHGVSEDDARAAAEARSKAELIAEYGA